MKERPIIMSAESILALLDKRKEQTRRVFRNPPENMVGWRNSLIRLPDSYLSILRLCPYGVPGDRLWVKETWKFLSVSPRNFLDDPFPCRWQYRADDKKCYGPVPKEKLPKQFSASKWRSPLFMFRWASRITLEILNVRVERLKEITYDDIVAEGIEPRAYNFYLLRQFGELWDSLNSKRGYPWDANPWVWVLELRIVEVLDGNDFIKRSIN